MASAGRWLRGSGRMALFQMVRAAVRLFGLRRARALGRVAGELEYRITWRRRRRCEHDMAVALGRVPGDPWVAAQLRRAHHVNAHALIEILALLDRRHDAQSLTERLIVEGEEQLRAALAGGRGAILLGTHAGNGVLLALRLAHAGYPVSVVYRQARMLPEKFIGRGLARYGVEGIVANDGLRAYSRMLAAVKAGKIVFVTLDQGAKRRRNGIVVRFLGKDLGMPAGPAQLARHARAPVLPVVATGFDGTAWHFRIEAALPPVEGPLARAVENLARASERQALLHPELWSWHHRRRWYRQSFPHAKMRA